MIDRLQDTSAKQSLYLNVLSNISTIDKQHKFDPLMWIFSVVNTTVLHD